MKQALQTYTDQSEETLGNIAPANTVKQFAPFLEARSLTSFAEPISELFLPGSTAKEASEEILPNKPLIQTFVCHVDKLENIGIQFATDSRQNMSDVQVTLQEGDKILLQQQASAHIFQDTRPHYFALQEPIPDCLNREFLLVIESLNGSVEDSISVWTYPPYYSGHIESSVNAQGPKRVVGLELNGQAFQIFTPDNNDWK